MMESEADILIGSIYGDGLAIRPGEGGCLETLCGGLGWLGVWGGAIFSDVFPQ